MQGFQNICEQKTITHNIPCFLYKQLKSLMQLKRLLPAIY